MTHNMTTPQMPTEKLEALLGNKYLLVDDWNKLGWEFVQATSLADRIGILTNYTECKAEGGDLVFQIDQDFITRKYTIVILRETGTPGPHGIAFWSEFADASLEPIQFDTVEEIADAIRTAVKSESESSYWQPIRDDVKMTTLLWDTPQGRVETEYPR